MRRVVESRKASFEAVILDLTDHGLDTEESIIDILFRWSHLWSEASVRGKLACNYEDAFHGSALCER